jgi:hypothetical protein
MRLRKINLRKETISHNKNASYLQMRRTAAIAGRLSWAREGSGYLKSLPEWAND